MAALAEEIDSAGDARLRALVTRRRQPGALDPERRAPREGPREPRLHRVDRPLPERDHAPRPRDPPDDAAPRARQLRHRLPRLLGAQPRQVVAGGAREARRRRATCGRCSPSSPARLNGADAARSVDELMLRRAARRDGRPRGHGLPRRLRGRGPRAPRERAGPGAAPRPDAARRPLRRPLRRRGARALARRRSAAAEHGVDLGPLAPRLPALLATESGAIELAPDLLVADVERLERGLAERGRERRLRADRTPPPALEQLVDAQPAGAREGKGALHAARPPRGRPRPRARRRRPGAGALAGRRGRGARRAQRRE